MPNLLTIEKISLAFGGMEGSADDLGDREVLSSRHLGGAAPRLVATNSQI